MQAVLNPTFGERLKSLVRLLAMTALFSGSGIAAISAWQSYGEAARRATAVRLPRAAPSPSARADQAGMTVGLSTQATPPAARADDGASAGAPSGESAQLLQSLAHDVTALGQDMAELKERIGRLATGQDQMARDLARLRQPNPRADVRSAMAAAPLQTPAAASDPRKPAAPLQLSIPRPR
jgi:hypothetical protein